jgi:hypothetical protein
VLKKLHRSATATQGRQTHGQAILQERCHEATMAAQGRFISKLSEKGLPFFKLLKNADKFVWDEEAHQAFEALKEFLTSLPIMTTPVQRKHSSSTSWPPLMWSTRFLLPSEKKKGRSTLFSDLCIM